MYFLNSCVLVLYHDDQVACVLSSQETTKYEQKAVSYSLSKIETGDLEIFIMSKAMLYLKFPILWIVWFVLGVNLQ